MTHPTSSDGPAEDSERPKIVHAPSDPKVKGTAEILAALEQLSDRHDFELVLIQNLTHEEAMAEYLSADLAIDQILAGWYGGLAVELMALGKPVACYVREEDFQFVPPELVDDLPILRIRPESLEQDLDDLFQRRTEWIAWGQASRAFVEKWHDPRKIAQWMAHNYRNPADRSDFNPRGFAHQ